MSGEGLTSLEARWHLVEALRTDLVGPMREDEVLPQQPSRWYLTGFVVSKSAPEEQRGDPTADEKVSSGVQGEADDDNGDTGRPSPRPFFPSSLGLSWGGPG